MQIDVSRFRAAFYVEAAEHLQHMEGALLQLEGAPRDTELLNTIFRAAHSIKGASTTFGIDEVGRFTHVLENLLERLRDGHVETSSELVELLLSSIDVIEGLIANAKDGAPIPSNLEQVFVACRIFSENPDFFVRITIGYTADVNKYTTHQAFIDFVTFAVVFPSESIGFTAFFQILTY